MSVYESGADSVCGKGCANCWLGATCCRCRTVHDVYDRVYGRRVSVITRKMLKKLLFLFEMPFNYRQRRAMKERQGVSLEAFKSHFPATEKEAEEVWYAFRSVAVEKYFCPMPGDDLLKLYGIADEDLDELILGMLTKLGYCIPGPEKTRNMAPLITVRDVVLFLKMWRKD